MSPSKPNPTRPQPSRDTRPMGSDDTPGDSDFAGFDEPTTVGPLPTEASASSAAPRKSRPATPFVTDDTESENSVTSNDRPDFGVAKTVNLTTPRDEHRKSRDLTRDARTPASRDVRAREERPLSSEQRIAAKRKAAAAAPASAAPVSSAPVSSAPAQAPATRRQPVQRKRPARDTATEEQSNALAEVARMTHLEDATDADASPRENRDVLGAPERTVVAPLPRQEEDVEPIPEAKPRKRKAPREAAREPEKPARSRLSAEIDLDEHEPLDRASRRKTSVTTDESAPAPAPRPDTAWTRFQIAVVDLWRVVVLSAKTNWKILRTQGPRPFIERAKPGARRLWAKIKTWALFAWDKIRTWARQAQRAVTVKAVELGIMKKPAGYETEAQSSNTADRGRAEEWRRFQKGKTSSSYLQDDE